MRLQLTKDDNRPDFLGIGAHKAATNWLWYKLREHPGIWMPPIKELHWFDRSRRYPSPSYLSSPTFARRLFGREKHNADFRRLFVRKLGAVVRDRQWPEIPWRIKHLVGHYDDEWYFSLFEEGRGRLKGEITPSYSILDLEDVQAIRALLPELKILLILRNPIDRAWSHVRFDWTRGWFTGIESLEEIRKYIDGPKQRLRGDYLRMIDNWCGCYPSEQVFIGFYDDIIADPNRLVREVYRFLGLPPFEPVETSESQERKNVSGKKDIPVAIRRYLAEIYRPDIEALHARFGGHTAAWLAEANEILRETESPSQLT